MNIRYVRYGTVRVSARWALVLKAADKAGVKFKVNSGHRSFAEQARLFHQNMIRPGVPRPGRPLTAVPSPFAPHVRSGRHAHALDVNSVDGGETRLQKFLERHGAKVTNPVPGESWHMEVSGRDLHRLAQRFAPPKRNAKAISQKGLEFLVKEEGVVPWAYNDSEGHATFGVGHLIHLGPVNDKDRARWGTKRKPKTREFAMKVFRKDLAAYEATVRDSVDVGLAAHEFDALVSLCFNIGRAGFRESTVVRKLNAGNRRGAADAIRLWDRPSVLRARRERERALFLHGHA